MCAVSITKAREAVQEGLVRLLRTGVGTRLLSRQSVSRAEMRSVSEAAGRIWLWDDAERVPLAEPIQEGDLPQELKDTAGHRIIDAPFVCEVPGVALVGPNALAITHANRFLLEQSLGSLNLLARDVATTLSAGQIPRHRSPAAVVDTFETAVSLAGPWNPSYFHWFSDHLPRLAGVEHYRRETGTDPTVIVPPSPTAWMQRSLERLGFSQWTEWSGETAFVESLVVPTVRRETQLNPPVDRSWVYSPSAYRWVRDRILEDEADSESAPTRVYISRTDADSRRVANESAVIDLLEDYGFTGYVLTELGFDDQVTLFKEAEAVVAPHGAGLTNIMWGSSMTVVELFGDYENNSYYTLAKSLGHEYAVLKCTPVEDDMLVDTDRLRALLDRTLE